LETRRHGCERSRQAAILTEFEKERRGSEGRESRNMPQAAAGFPPPALCNDGQDQTNQELANKSFDEIH